MLTNKERIECIEAELWGMMDNMKQMELGINDKLHHLEVTISKLEEPLSATKETPSHGAHKNAGSSCSSSEESVGDVNSFHQEWPNWNSLTIPVITKPSGSIEQHISLNIRKQRMIRKWLWLLSTLKAKPTSGGNGCARGLTRRKMNGDMGNICGRVRGSLLSIVPSKTKRFSSRLPKGVWTAWQ